MRIDLKLGTDGIVDKQDAYIIAYVTVAQGVEVVEECQVTCHQIAKAMRTGQRRANHAAGAAIDTTTANIAGALYASGEREHIPTAAAIGGADMEE